MLRYNKHQHKKKTFTQLKANYYLAFISHRKFKINIHRTQKIVIWKYNSKSNELGKLVESKWTCCQPSTHLSWTIMTSSANTSYAISFTKFSTAFIGNTYVDNFNWNSTLSD